MLALYAVRLLCVSSKHRAATSCIGVSHELPTKFPRQGEVGAPSVTTAKKNKKKKKIRGKWQGLGEKKRDQLKRVN